MFWKKSRPRRTPNFRPSMEPLEGRLAMAASITPFTDFDGVQGVRVIDGSAASELIITDDPATDTQVLTLKQKNKPDLVAQGQFRLFEIEMGGGNDRVEYDALSTFVSDARAFHINLGAGKNTLDFKTNAFNITENSLLELNVQGGTGNDFVDIVFDDVFSSALTVLGRLGGGADAQIDAKNKVIGPSKVTLATTNGDVGKSSVLVDFDLGTGSNQFLYHMDGDVGTSPNFRTAQVDVRIAGSPKKGDVDNVIVDLEKSSVDTASNLAFHIDLFAGNDKFEGRIPSNFGVRNDLSTAAGGDVLFDVDGGAGNDQITITRNGSATGFRLDGLMTLLLCGGEGNDSINVDFGGTGYFSSQVATGGNRGIKLRATGDAGNDTLNVQLSNNNTASFCYDVQLLAGIGNDKVNFLGNNNGGNPTFGPVAGVTGAILIDGGAGTDLRSVLGNFGVGVQPINFEGTL